MLRLLDTHGGNLLQARAAARHAHALARTGAHAAARGRLSPPSQEMMADVAALLGPAERRAAQQAEADAEAEAARWAAAEEAEKAARVGAEQGSSFPSSGAI